ncbi:MAG: GNAT family N-acetyltransferase [bacterium]|jgi:predicted N-acetyltransferase YhbS
MIKIHDLPSENVTPAMLDSFDRSQKTTRILVNEGGGLTEKEAAFEDRWSLEKKRELTGHFARTLADGGAVIVAERENEVIGFAVVEAPAFGEKAVYRELSFLHVTRPDRGRGIGKRLFQQAKAAARQMGAARLYISAHPAVETQRFYRKMGCVPAQEINEDIYRREPYDIQLETVL